MKVISWMLIIHVISYFARAAPKNFDLNALDKEWTKGDEKVRCAVRRAINVFLIRLYYYEYRQSWRMNLRMMTLH